MEGEGSWVRMTGRSGEKKIKEGRGRAKK